jgi:hypothetical protein
MKKKYEKKLYTINHLTHLAHDCNLILIGSNKLFLAEFLKE